MDPKTKGMERLMLLLSIFVGMTVVFFAAIGDYTLSGMLKGPVEVFLGLLFLFAVGFALVWTIYGIVMFIVKGFSNPNEISQDLRSFEGLGEISHTYHPLPEIEKPKEQKSLLPWRKQIENTRSAMSKIRIRLINKTKQKKLFKRSAGSRILKFSCKYCAQKITVPLIHAGKKGQCLKCNNILVIPSIKTIRSILAKKKYSVYTRPARPTFVPKAKVEAEEMAKTKVWNAIHAEIVANAPLAGTSTKIKGSSRPGIQQKTSVKSKTQASNKAAIAAAKHKAVLRAKAMKKIQPVSSEFNVFEVMQTVKRNAMASAV